MTIKGNGYRHILVATDFSACSEQAVAHAQGLAKSFGASIRFIHVMHHVSTYLEGWEGPVVMTAANQVFEEIERQAKRHLAALVKGTSHADSVLREGHPSTEIVKEAERFGADLLVLGTHGRTGLDRVLLGSVAHQVVQKSSCPVLVIKVPALRSRKP